MLFKNHDFGRTQVRRIATIKTLFMHQGYAFLELRRIFKVAIGFVVVLLIGGVGLFWADNSRAILVFPEVWSRAREEGEYQLNVAMFSGVGYAYSHYYFFRWDEQATTIIR